jgi:flagellar hook-associated protein 2
LGFSDGQTDRLTLSSTLSSLPFAKTLDAGGQFNFKINNVDFSFSSTDSLSTVISRINNSDAGVTLGYSSITDKFSLTAEETGAGDNIQITQSTGNLMNVLGLAGTENTDMITTAGKNAELTVNGQSIVRTSNSIEVNGVKIELLNKSDDAITVNMKEDATSLKDTIKSFVTDYNNMIESMNKLYKEKADSDYPPLTDEQKSSMSETEISNWETKAKVGLLEGDSIIKGITSKMQSLMYSSAVSGGISLYDMGITSAGYTENGKLQIDDAKLTTALETKGSQIKELFTTSSTGLANKLNDVITGAVKTSGAKGTRGSLIEAAGYEATTSDTENSITENITKTNKVITSLKDKLKDEETYYWNKFSALETALSQLNSQSSMLSQFSSGA